MSRALFEDDVKVVDDKDSARGRVCLRVARSGEGPHEEGDIPKEGVSKEVEAEYQVPQMRKLPRRHNLNNIREPGRQPQIPQPFQIHLPRRWRWINLDVQLPQILQSCFERHQPRRVLEPSTFQILAKRREVREANLFEIRGGEGRVRGCQALVEDGVQDDGDEEGYEGGDFVFKDGEEPGDKLGVEPWACPENALEGSKLRGCGVGGFGHVPIDAEPCAVCPLEVVRRKVRRHHRPPIMLPGILLRHSNDITNIAQNRTGACAPLPPLPPWHLQPLPLSLPFIILMQLLQSALQPPPPMHGRAAKIAIREYERRVEARVVGLGGALLDGEVHARNSADAEARKDATHVAGGPALVVRGEASAKGYGFDVMFL